MELERAERLRRFDLAQERGDVHASVLGAERPEPARGLLELPLRSDRIAAAGLVPGDDDVHEPLEEVFLLWLGGAPGILERLVRGEVFAAAGKVEARLEAAACGAVVSQSIPTLTDPSSTLTS